MNSNIKTCDDISCMWRWSESAAATDGEQLRAAGECESERDLRAHREGRSQQVLKSGLSALHFHVHGDWKSVKIWVASSLEKFWETYIYERIFVKHDLIRSENKRIIVIIFPGKLNN